MIAGVPVGTCYDDPTGFYAPGYIIPTSCGEPHDNEVFARLVIPHDSWPGESGTDDWSFDACNDEFEAYTGDSFEESALDYGWRMPLEDDWQIGDRTVVCALWNCELIKLVGSMKNGTGV